MSCVTVAACPAFRWLSLVSLHSGYVRHSTSNDGQEIAAAAKELNELRENWLNPPEWTTTRVLEFPGSVDGPWARFIAGGTAAVPSTGRDSARPSSAVGTVRYPRLEPRDDDCAKKLAKRTLTNLYNERPAWLEHGHTRLDRAVAAAYGWSDLTEILERSRGGEIYDFETGTWGQVDCTPEGFEKIIAELERKVDEQFIERLLALNLERAAGEAAAAKLAPKKTSSRAKTADELI